MPANGKKKNVGGWIGSIVLILCAITSFSVAGIISGILFLICGAFVNPIFQNLLTENIVALPAGIITSGYMKEVSKNDNDFPHQCSCK